MKLNNKIVKMTNSKFDDAVPLAGRRIVIGENG